MIGPDICTVDGLEVEELAVLFKPSAFLVTLGNGTHELTRTFYHRGQFTVGTDIRRLGGLGVERVAYDTQKGLRVSFERGYEVFIPSSHCQATWKLPD